MQKLLVIIIKKYYYEEELGLKVIVHLPEDMTEIYKKMDEFKAKKVVRECTPRQVDAIIEYFKKMKEEEKLEGKD